MKRTVVFDMLRQRRLERPNLLTEPIYDDHHRQIHLRTAVSEGKGQGNRLSQMLSPDQMHQDIVCWIFHPRLKRSATGLQVRSIHQCIRLLVCGEDSASVLVERASFFFNVSREKHPQRDEVIAASKSSHLLQRARRVLLKLRRLCRLRKAQRDADGPGQEEEIGHLKAVQLVVKPVAKQVRRAAQHCQIRRNGTKTTLLTKRPRSAAPGANRGSSAASSARPRSPPAVGPCPSRSAAARRGGTSASSRPST